MVKRPYGVIVAVSIVAYLLYCYVYADERRIRANLHLVADVASKAEGEHKLAFVGKVRSLENLLHEQISVAPGKKLKVIVGREKLKGLFVQAWRTFGNWQIVFSDVTFVGPIAGGKAKTRQTVSVTTKTKRGRELLTPREMVIEWQHQDGSWLIVSAAHVEVFK
mgnify:CR=1 FL=1